MALSGYSTREPRPEPKQELPLRRRVNKTSDAADDLALLFDYGRQRGWLTSTVSSRALAIWWYGAALGWYLAESNDAFDADEWADIMLDVLPYLAFGQRRTD